MIPRRELTNLALVTLKQLGIPVGDAETPTEQYGWTDTPRSNADFIPYLILTPGGTSEFRGSLANPDADMWFPYQITGFGSTREQCEWVMDKAREHLEILEFRRIEADQSTYKISNVDIKNVGGIVRGGPDETKVFGQTDTVTIFVSEEIL